MDNELLVKTIRTLCKDNNISVSQLENDLNFGAGLISRWTKSSPSLDKIIDIADYFHVTLDEVVGRNQKTIDDENQDFISLLTKLTQDHEIQWSNYFSIPYDERKTIILPEEYNVILKDFSVFPDEQRKMDKIIAKYNNGYFILSCYLIIINNMISKYEFFFYIQPPNESKPVYQSCNQEQLLDLYKKIVFLIYGSSAEMEADEFKKEIIANNVAIKKREIALNEANDNNYKIGEVDYLTFVKNTDFKTVYETYTKITEILNSAQEQIEEFNNIQKNQTYNIEKNN